MNFKTWKIKVTFHEIDYDTITEERHERLLMEHTLNHLINECDYMPRQNDMIGDLEGMTTPFIIERIAFDVNAKFIVFALSMDEGEV